MPMIVLLHRSDQLTVHDPKNIAPVASLVVSHTVSHCKPNTVSNVVGKYNLHYVRVM